MSLTDAVLELPRQLEWATEFEIEDFGGGRLVLFGDGGSALAASIAALTARPTSSVIVHAGFDPASSVRRDVTLAVAIADPGSEERARSCVEGAREAGVDAIGIWTEGALAGSESSHRFPVVTVPATSRPADAIGYQVGAAVRVLEAAGLVDDAVGQLDEAVSVLDSLLGDGNGAAFGLGADIAGAFRDRVRVVDGGSSAGAVAADWWKHRIDAVAEVPVSVGDAVGPDRGELHAGASGTEASGDRTGVVLFVDAGAESVPSGRLEQAEELLATLVPLVGSVHSQGDGPLARFFSLAVVGDAVAATRAEEDGDVADPTR